jgi:hypothetical protein
MLYKTLKQQQLDKLKKDKQFKEYVAAIKDCQLEAYADLRNLLFDREIGTNILTQYFTKSDDASFEDGISLLIEVKKAKLTELIPGDVIENLANVPDKKGQTLVMQVLQKTKYNKALKFLEVIERKVTSLIN